MIYDSHQLTDGGVAAANVVRIEQRLELVLLNVSCKILVKILCHTSGLSYFFKARPRIKFDGNSERVESGDFVFLNISSKRAY